MAAIYRLQWDGNAIYGLMATDELSPGTGALSSTLGTLTSVASGAATLAGASAVTLGAMTTSATGVSSATRTGSVDSSLAACTLSVVVQRRMLSAPPRRRRVQDSTRTR